MTSAATNIFLWFILHLQVLSSFWWTQSLVNWFFRYLRLVVTKDFYIIFKRPCFLMFICSFSMQFTVFLCITELTSFLFEHHIAIVQLIAYFCYILMFGFECPFYTFISLLHSFWPFGLVCSYYHPNSYLFYLTSSA